MIFEKKGTASFGAIIAVIGSVLIGLGIAWLLAMNWHQIPDFLKVIILVLLTIISYSVGTILKTHNYFRIAGSLVGLGSVLYTLSIFLIAQIYATPTGPQGIAYLLLIAWIGVLLVSYIFDSRISLIIFFVNFLAWLVTQYIAFSSKGQRFGFSYGPLALLLLAVGVLFYGLSLIHKSQKHKFSIIYTWWSILYFLIFAYILAIQRVVSALWPFGLQLPSSLLLFLISISGLSVIAFCTGVILNTQTKNIDDREIFAILGFIVLFIILILTASLVSGTLGRCNVKTCYDFTSQSLCENADLPNQACGWERNSCRQLNCYTFRDRTSCLTVSSKLNCVWQPLQAPGGQTTEQGRCNSKRESVRPYVNIHQVCNQYNNERDACLSKDDCKWMPSAGGSFRAKDVPFRLWAVWIFSNIAFLLVILSVIGYGLLYKSSKIVNLGIAFFVLDVITRYLGFVIGFWGYTSLAILFISGGILLIAGGLAVEKWRRHLVKEAEK